MTKMSEARLQEEVANYLRRSYPDVLFHSDFGSGAKLARSQAIRQKRQNGGRRAWPDLFVAEPIGDRGGLFIELKCSGTRLAKVRHPDEWATPHIAEQAEVLRVLRNKGYAAEFGVGFADTMRIIEDYLGGCHDDDATLPF